MPKTIRPLWGEGLFLRPQHFQQQDAYYDQQLFYVRQLTARHSWGLRRISIDHDALANGVLRLTVLNLQLADGTVVIAPENEPLPPSRNLVELPGLGTTTTVYACLPLISAFGNNCGFEDENTSRPTRYILQHASVYDLYTNAIETEISGMNMNLVLMLEPENRDGYLCLPIAVLTKNAAGRWGQLTDYIPPLIEIGASGKLMSTLQGLLDILLVKSQMLAASHRERVQSIVEYGTSDIASFWLLHTVNQAFPVLKHLHLFPSAHPEELYKCILQLAGQLLTFSSTQTLNDLPVYQHDDLNNCFLTTDTLIRDLLDTVVSQRYVAIPLSELKPSFMIGHLEGERLTEGADFYLSISTEHPINQLVETVPIKLKVGAPDDVEKILNSALPGVRLTHAIQTPSALPVRVGNYYFNFEPNGQIFERMLRSRSICIYVPQALSNLKIELLAVFR